MPSPSSEAVKAATDHLVGDKRTYTPNKYYLERLAIAFDSFAAAQVEAAVTRLESRLAAAEKLRAGVGEVILRQPAHNNEVGYFNVHLDEFGEEHVEQVDPGAVLGSTVACLMEIVATYDAAREENQ